MISEIKNILLILNVFLCSFFIIYLISFGKSKSLTKKLLIGFLAAKGLTQLAGIFYHFEGLNTFLLDNFYQLFYLPYPFYYLFTPLFYLSVLSISRDKFALRKSQTLHFLPFIFFFAYLFVNFNLYRSEEVIGFIRNGYFFRSIDTHVFFLLSYLQFFFYGTASLIELNRYQTRIKDVFSDVEKIRLDWLILVTWGFFGWKFIQTFNYVMWLSGLHIGGMVLYIISEILFLTFATFLFMRISKSPHIFSDEIMIKTKIKYEKIPLPEEMKESIKKKLITYMETEKPYLNPSINLNTLAENISVNPHYLSQTLNTELGQNFYDFINSYRIEECKILLSNRELKDKTILEILYETGFNSKSVFNTVFKKNTGMTPSQYKKFIVN